MARLGTRVKMPYNKFSQNIASLHIPLMCGLLSHHLFISLYLLLILCQDFRLLLTQRNLFSHDRKCCGPNSALSVESPKSTGSDEQTSIKQFTSRVTLFVQVLLNLRVSICKPNVKISISSSSTSV